MRSYKNGHQITVEHLINVVQATIDKVELCRDRRGGHFEHLGP
ncbi:unnamed protein product [Acanthoscelides obtectus]|uniref:Uncharacterized protein n=1 Tax=Acanthoscelides obtectus TaxID=200917 RepID=A0A9P0L7V6_ACAOB|nr:unnamed protein product [Acanthoscelides obtectus]CAK1627733.1 hypothetical protein AOBTE_LOCUS4798 [Acanthoscelides obtectus]